MAFASVGGGSGGYLAIDVVVVASVVMVEGSYRSAFVGGDADALPAAFDVVVAAATADEETGWGELAVDAVVEEYVASAALEVVLAVEVALVALEVCPACWTFVVSAPPALSGTLLQTEEDILYTTPPIDSVQQHLR